MTAVAEVGEIEDARFKAQVVRERLDVFAVAAGQNRTEIAIFREARRACR